MAKKHEKYSKNAFTKGQGRIILVSLILLYTLLFASLVSAESFTDTSKNYNKVTDTISIKDKLNEPLADFQLIYNTKSCSNDCFAIIKATIKKGSSGVLSKLEFQDVKKGKVTIPYNIQIKNINGEFANYNPAQELNGVYIIKITGTKDWGDVIDWQPTLYDVLVDEWAIWGNWYYWDNYIGVNINASKWENKTSGSGGTNTFTQTANSYLEGIAKSGASGGTYANVWFNTSSLIDFTFANNITFLANITSDSCSDASSLANLYAFGVLINKTCANSQYHVWTLTKNESNYSVFADGVHLKEIKPLSKNIGVYVSSAYNVGIHNASARLYQINYTYSNNTMNINLISPADASNTYIDERVIFNITSGTLINNLFNITLYLNGIQNETQSISGTNNTTIFNMSLPSGFYNWYVRVCDSDKNCLNSLSRTLTNTPYKINTLWYNNITSSGAIEPFILNLTYDSASFTGVSVILNYNNTNYTTTSSGTGNDLIFSTNITVPTVSATTNKSFYWILGVSNSNGINYYNTSIYNQTIGTFLVDDCSAYTNRLLNLTMMDEESLSKINGTIEVEINFYTSGTTNLIGNYNNTFNYTTTGSSAVCLNNISTSYDMSYQIRYYGNSSLYVKKYKIVQLMTITNTTINQNITLYNILKTSAPCPFKIILTGSPLPTYNSNLLIEAQKQYIGLNQFLPVEDSLSDSDGNGLLNLVPDSEVYKFIVSYNGNVLLVSNNYKPHCQTPSTCQCTITLNIAETTGTITDYNNYKNVSISYLLNNDTQTLYTTYVSTDGKVHTVYQIITKDDGYGNTTICNNTGIGTSGTLVCAVPSIYQNTNIWSAIYVDGKFVGNKFFGLAPETNYYGVDVLIELLMFSSIVMLFLSNPILIVIGSIVGLLSGIILIFISGGAIGVIIGVAIYYVVAGAIAIWQMGRKI